MARAKFRVTSIENHETHGAEGSVYLTVNAQPVGDEDPEGFNKWTPSGKLQLSITNPNLKDYFKPGKNYYLDFSEAE